MEAGSSQGERGAMQDPIRSSQDPIRSSQGERGAMQDPIRSSQSERGAMQDPIRSSQDPAACMWGGDADRPAHPAVCQAEGGPAEAAATAAGVECMEVKAAQQGEGAGVRAGSFVERGDGVDSGAGGGSEPTCSEPTCSEPTCRERVRGGAHVEVQVEAAWQAAQRGGAHLEVQVEEEARIIRTGLSARSAAAAGSGGALGAQQAAAEDVWRKRGSSCNSGSQDPLGSSCTSVSQDPPVGDWIHRREPGSTWALEGCGESIAPACSNPTPGPVQLLLLLPGSCPDRVGELRA